MCAAFVLSPLNRKGKGCRRQTFRRLTTKSCAFWQNFGSGLSGLGDKEYTKEEVYTVLNNMADIGDIYFRYPDGRTCDVRINGSFLQDIQRDFIQYMAIFIAVFALVNVNLNGLEGRTIKDFLGINLFLVASMTTLGALLDIVLCRPQNECGFPKKSMLLWCGSIVLWAISIIALICI